MAEYYLIVKTGDAEMKALEQTSSQVLNCITPIVELTRGRKLPSKEKDPELRKKERPQYPYTRKLERISEVLAGKKVIFDLTSDKSLMSDETDLLYDHSNGYQNWISLLKELKQSGAFSELIPTIIVGENDPDVDSSIKSQTDTITRIFDAIAYRSDIYDDNCYYDIEKNIVPNLNGKRLYVIVDCSYVIQASIGQYSDRVKARVRNLNLIVPSGTTIIVSATSFPRNIGEVGDDSTDSFQLSEVSIAEELAKDGLVASYSDYGSINPIRNDNVVMAHGWIPRIDVPLKNSFFYYRERRPKNTKEYAETYKRVARAVLRDPDFPRDIDDNWGIKQIKACASGYSPASAPAFWISVRMCIHIEQQVRRLELLDKKKS